MYEPPVSFDPRTYLATRGARICYFKATNSVLKEKRQGTEVKVRWITSEYARNEGYGRVVNEAEIEEGTSVRLAKGVFGD